MNPFKYGTVVSDPYFVNREREIREISNSLENGINIILYAPRRYGKTSLIKKILKEQGEAKSVYIDFFQVTSLQKFIDLYTNAIMKTQNISVKKIVNLINKFIKGITTTISFDATGNPTINLNISSRQDKETTLIDVLELPQKLTKSNEKFYIVFDEFQEIEKLNGIEFEKQLRSVIQYHTNISYVFMGSKTHLLLNMFNDKNRAFFNIGKIYHLKKISKQEMLSFLINGFKKSKIRFEKDVVEQVLKITDNIPYYVQYLASELWEISFESDMQINLDILEQAVDRILDNQSDYYFMIYDNLTVYQRNLLLSLTKENEKVFSKGYSQKYNLSSISSIQRAISSLIQNGIIEKVENKYKFTDPFFQRYLNLRMFA